MHRLLAASFVYANRERSSTQPDSAFAAQSTAQRLPPACVIDRQPAGQIIAGFRDEGEIVIKCAPV